MEEKKRSMAQASTSSPSRRKSRFFQFLRFCFVGGLNTVIDLVLFNIFVQVFPTNDVRLLLLYNSLAYLIGGINSFVLNKLWTFRQRSKATGGQFLRFVAVTSAGILCNDMLLWLLTGFFLAFSLTGFIWTNLAKVCAIGGTVAISYMGMRLSVFKADEEFADPAYSPGLSLWSTTRSLSVILPAYNEELLIEQTLIQVMQTLTKWIQNFEVIVVNDGSKDQTGEIVRRLSLYDQRVRLVDHPVNQGYGAALVSGFAAVTKDLAFFMDADGQFDIQDLGRLFPLIEEYGAVLGYRIARQDSWMRKLNAWCWKQLVRFVFRVQVRDIDCAFKLLRADFVHAYPLETRGAMINTELLYKLSRAGYTYTEVGVQHLPRRAGKATGAKPIVILRALRELFASAEKWRQEEQLAALTRYQ
jgi:putative flippase GtrA